MTTPPDLSPDTKDWTWVLDRPCGECGYDSSAVARDGFGERVRRNARTWPPLLALPDATTRPDPTAWSAIEYAAHVRDVHRVFGGRLEAMLDEDDPLFDDWDQDAASVAGRYSDLDPRVVAAELVVAADEVATAYDAVAEGPQGDAAWARRGRRSNGSVFTVESLGRYHLHDVEHHAWDVRAAGATATVAAYEGHAGGYRTGTATLPDVVRDRLDDLVGRLGEGARVLEIGSGPGRDAAHLDTLGLTVRRTDVTPAFVAMIRADGHRADVVDPLTDDLRDPDDPRGPDATYDGVWANACLLHVARTDLPVVLARLAEVTRPGGVLSMSVKEGDGEVWSKHGQVAAPRRFVLWRAEPLSAVLDGAGWDLETLLEADGLRGERWLMAVATRRG